MVCKASDEHRYNASSLRLQCDNRNRVCGMAVVPTVLFRVRECHQIRNA